MVDLKFKRIAVSIFNTYPLGWYFFNRTLMEKVTYYFDVYNLWNSIGTSDIFTTSEFLNTLYDKNPSTLATLLSAIVNDLPNYYYDIYPRHPAALKPIYGYVERKRRLLQEFAGFFHELETIGITWDGEEFRLAVGTIKLDITIKSHLETILSELGSEYLAKYHGAIEALMSDNPDGFSQSLSSMRDLLTSILNLLTKDDEFTNDERSNGGKGPPKRKARIKHILQKSQGLGAEIELSEALANTLHKTYDVLSKRVHKIEKKDWNNILYIFKSTEYLIYYILLQQKINMLGM